MINKIFKKNKVVHNQKLIDYEKPKSFISKNTDYINGFLSKGFLFWFVFTFLILPNVATIYSVFSSGGRLSLDGFTELLDSEYVVKSLTNSFILGILLSITVNIVGTFMVLVTELFEIKGSKFLRVIYMSPLVFSGMVCIIGYVFIYGQSGFITNQIVKIYPAFNTSWFEGMWPVIFVMTFAGTANHIIFLKNAISRIDNYTIEAARNMGTKNFTLLRKIVFPTILPTFISLTILTFLGGLSALSAPRVIGGDFSTINTVILGLIQLPTKRDSAAALASLLGVSVVILLVVLTKFEKGKGYMSVSKSKSKLQKLKFQTVSGKFITHTFAYLFALIQLLPILFVFIFSFTNTESIISLKITTITFQNYLNVLSNTRTLLAVTNSIKFALIGSILATVTSLIATRLIHKKENKKGKLGKFNYAFKSFIKYTFLTPWVLPASLISIGLITTYGTPHILIANKGIIASSLALIFAYMIIKLPYSQRMLHSAYYSIDGALEKAAKNLGASSFYTIRRVIVPILFPTLIALIALNFISILPEYDISAILASHTTTTIGSQIAASTSDMASGDTQAMMLVYSVIVMTLSSFSLMIVYLVILRDKNNKKLLVNRLIKKVKRIKNKIKKNIVLKFKKKEYKHCSTPVHKEQEL